MSFHQFIQYKALDRMYSAGNSKFFETVIASDPAFAEKNKMRNVCALIHTELFDRLENTCAYLDISKREFIESAVIEALNMADAITKEVGLDAYFDAASEAADKDKA